MFDGIGQRHENLKELMKTSEEYVEINRHEQKQVMDKKEFELNNMSPEKRLIVESVTRALLMHEMDFGFKFKEEEAKVVKNYCIYLICKEQQIKCERPSCKMDHTREDSINIVSQAAREILEKIEVRSWNVNYIISDLYIYNPKNKSQSAIEKIIRLPNPRAVNPLLNALKKSNNHRDMILNALLAYVTTHEEYIWEVNTDESLLILWAAKYALIDICLQPFSKNAEEINLKHLSELIKTVPEYSKFILSIGVQLSSSDPNDRIRGVKNIGRRHDTLFRKVLENIYKRDPDFGVKEAAKSLLKPLNKNKSESAFHSMLKAVWNDDYQSNQEIESYNDINNRDFEAQIEENEEYLDDILAGLYR
ncbi:MAG: hypothetical protein NKF70_08435 [Methanobacterium sp. ERen5]|nr:MAG: hypothetical protein NKF70_08435 [Methanobacterium sp. ERen5]